ncbi:hypothetical protein BJ165DRAFT_1488931 [Panaeolus papilionaceus]|nr:hypothetical protein BJ165DRAFT_1488931 [Panaeolus papilionaceus]
MSINSAPFIYQGDIFLRSFSPCLLIAETPTSMDVLSRLKTLPVRFHALYGFTVNAQVTKSAPDLQGPCLS